LLRGERYGGQTASVFPLTDLGAPRTIDLNPGTYALVPVHRAGNVEHPEVLARLSATLGLVAERLKGIFHE
jgi:hypothetical protein